MGALGTYVSITAIFIASAILCIPALSALHQIRADQIEYVRARNAAKHDHTLDLQRLVDFAKNRNLLLFAVCMVLFHFSNASLLPLREAESGAQQNRPRRRVYGGPDRCAANHRLVVPQIIVAILAPWIVYWSELWGRKPLLLIGFAVEAARALLFSFMADPWLMVVIEVLDGTTGAVVTVLTVLVITDFTTGTGRFNLAQGVLGTFTILGACTLRLSLPETKPVKYLD
jgi:hypothetical protein